jgi:hypothetical protein
VRNDSRLSTEEDVEDDTRRDVAENGTLRRAKRRVHDGAKMKHHAPTTRASKADKSWKSCSLRGPITY